MALRRLSVASAALLLCAVPAALAADGGTGVPPAPTVGVASCALQPAWTCARGQLMTLRGENLEAAASLTFLGDASSKDNVVVKLSARASNPTQIRVTVPKRARSGRVRIEGSTGENATTSEAMRVVNNLPATDDASNSRKLIAGGKRRARFSYDATDAPAGGRVEAIRGTDGKVVRSWTIVKSGRGEGVWTGFVGKRPAKSGTYLLRFNSVAASSAKVRKGSDTRFEMLEGFFPIRGKHTLARSPGQLFGGGRGHQGTDHFARCGTPLAAWTSGVVQYNAYQGAAGNYIVVRRSNGESYAYMHMRERSPAKVGTKVFAGQRLGHLSDSGDAQGCHLHIELWTAPGWYKGGRPYDSLPLMKRLDKLS